MRPTTTIKGQYTQVPPPTHYLKTCLPFHYKNFQFIYKYNAKKPYNQINLNYLYKNNKIFLNISKNVKTLKEV